MPRLTKENLERARQTIALYPRTRSALLPLLHLLQEQDGYLTEDGMEHVAELVGTTPAEVYGTASFYDMLFTHPVGRHLVSICTNVACLLNGGYELLDHAERRLGVKNGGTTPDGGFTLEEVECIALCDEAPCLAVNWRFFGNVSNERFDQLVDDLAAGRLREVVPPHGTLNRVRRSVGLLAGAPAKAAPSATEGAAQAEPGRTAGEPAGKQPESAEEVRGAARDTEEVRSEGDTGSDESTGERT